MTMACWSAGAHASCTWKIIIYIYSRPQCNEFCAVVSQEYWNSTQYNYGVCVSSAYTACNNRRKLFIFSTSWMKLCMCVCVMCVMSIYFCSSPQRIEEEIKCNEKFISICISIDLASVGLPASGSPVKYRKHNTNIQRNNRNRFLVHSFVCSGSVLYGGENVQQYLAPCTIVYMIVYVLAMQR